MQPRISIITITYNSEKTLDRAIRSVLSQDYPNLEYIIVDGASTDSTLDIVRQYEGRLKWYSEPDTGISNAFNKGIMLSTGDIIGIINSDDGLLPGALKALASVYNKETDVYRGNVVLWKEDTNTKVIEKPSMHFTFGAMNRIAHQGTFITKDAYNRYGVFDENLAFAMDYDLMLRYERAGARFQYVDYNMAYYSLGGKTFSVFTQERMQELVQILRQNNATSLDILCFKTIKYAKLVVQKVIPKEMTMLLRNRRQFKGEVQR